MAITDVLKALLPIAATAGGYALKRSAQSKADKERSAIIRQMSALNDDALRKQLAVTDQQVAQYAPTQRLPALQEREQQAVQRYEGAVTAPDALTAGPQYGGRVSDAYTTGQAQRTADELRYATKLASLMRRAVAPADLALNESFANQDAALERGGIRSDLRGDLGIAGNRLNAVEPSGGMMLAGDALMGAGIAYGTPRQDLPLIQGMAPITTPSLNPANVMTGIAAKRPRWGSTSYWTGGRR